MEYQRSVPPVSSPVMRLSKVMIAAHLGLRAPTRGAGIAFPAVGKLTQLDSAGDEMLYRSIA
jgi:hypothetical protein